MHNVWFHLVRKSRWFFLVSSLCKVWQFGRPGLSVQGTLTFCIQIVLLWTIGIVVVALVILMSDWSFGFLSSFVRYNLKQSQVLLLDFLLHFQLRLQYLCPWLWNRFALLKENSVVHKYGFQWWFVDDYYLSSVLS